MKEYHTNEGFQKTLEQGKTLTNDLQIVENFPVPTQIRRRAIQFSYEPIHDPKQSFKMNFFDPILDTTIQSIYDRFSQLTKRFIFLSL